jgi:hypothetical protein
MYYVEESQSLGTQTDRETGNKYKYEIQKKVPDTSRLVDVYNCLGPPLWSSGQSSWLQIRRPGFDSQHYQIFRGGKKKKENSSGSGTGSTQPREYN